MVAADVGRRREPEAGGGGEHLSLERHRRQHPIEGALPVGGDDQPAAVRQVVVVAHLAADRRRQTGNVGFDQDVVERRAHAPAQVLARFFHSTGPPELNRRRS